MAWLAAAAARREGGGVLVVGGKAFTDFGKEAGFDLASKHVAAVSLMEPKVLGPAVKSFKPVCNLMLIESLAAVAEAAAPASPEPAVTRTLRSRYLRRLMQDIAVALQARTRARPPQLGGQRPRRGAKAAGGPAPEGAAAAGNGAVAEGIGSAASSLRPMSVIVCNPRKGPQGPYDSILQQYAAMRLRLTPDADALESGSLEEPQALCEPPSIGVQMLKGPGTNSRMRPPATQLYLHAGPAEGTTGASSALPYGENGAAAVLDVVAAAELLGLLMYSVDCGSDGLSGARRDGDGVLCYKGCEAAGLLDFGDALLAAGLVPELRRDVGSALQALRGKGLERD